MLLRNSIRSAAVAASIALAPGAALATHDNVIPNPIQASGISVTLQEVPIHPELNAPTWATYAPGLDNYLFVADQDGQIFAKQLPDGQSTVFLDARDLIVQLGARPNLPTPPGPLLFDERGLIGLAFHPGFEHNGTFYTVTSEPKRGPAHFSTMPPGVAPNHQMVLREWHARNSGNPAAGVATQRGRNGRVLLRIDEPQFNHNSGAIVFDKDGMLLLAVGDGGGADDQPAIDLQDFIGVDILGHGAVGNGQNPSNILGTILRLDVNGTAVGGRYSIPGDNPFAADGGGGPAGCLDGTCDEIFAYGFRNIYRISVDMGGDRNVFAADVGQNDIEEVDVVVPAGNYGWAIKEGTFLFDHNGADEDNGPAFTTVDSPGSPPNMIDPVAQYDHDEGVAVLGGFVNREGGPLEGLYVFAEFAQPPFNPFAPNCDGRVFHLNNSVSDANLPEIVGNTFDGAIREFPGVAAGSCLTGLGQDSHGAVYVLGNDTGIPIPGPGSTVPPVGVVLKVVAN